MRTVTTTIHSVVGIVQVHVHVQMPVRHPHGGSGRRAVNPHGPRAVSPAEVPGRSREEVTVQRSRRRPTGRGRSARPALAAAVVGALLAAAVVVVDDLVAACPLADTSVATDAGTAPVLRSALAAATAAGELEPCARIDVTERDPAAMATLLAAGSSTLPGLWLPDSGIWPARVAAAPDRTVRALGSVATSPVVVVGATPSAGPVPLADLVGSPQVTGLVAPERDASGALTVLAAATALSGGDVAAPDPRVAAAFVALGRGVLPDAAAGFRQLDGGVPFVATARSVTAHTARDDTVTTTPVAGVPPADYPLVVLDRPGADPRLADTGARVLDALRGPAARDVLDDAGFGAARAGDAPAPTPGVSRVLDLWRTLTTGSALLAVIDVSGSMQSAAGSRTRIQLAADAAREGLGLFPPSTEIGLWTFSARPAPEPDFSVLVPVGPLRGPLPGGATRAEVLAGSAGRLDAVDGAGTALHQTALEAVRAMRAGFVPGKEHSVVLLTDGRDERDDGPGLDELLSTLRAEADPRRPVAVITIGIGPDADMEALRAIAEVTDGRAYQAVDPAEIRGVFLDALLLRACRPECN